MFVEAGITAWRRENRARRLSLSRCRETTKKSGGKYQMGCGHETRQAPCFADDEASKLAKSLGYANTCIHTKVEHTFHVIKNLFRHKKADYREMAKNSAHLFWPVRDCQFAHGAMAKNTALQPSCTQVVGRGEMR